MNAALIGAGTSLFVPASILDEVDAEWSRLLPAKLQCLGCSKPPFQSPVKSLQPFGTSISHLESKAYYISSVCLTRKTHKPFGTEYEFVSDLHTGALGSLGANVIICAASSEEKYNAVGTYSCTQRQEFSKLHFHVTSMVVSASAFTNTSLSFFFFLSLQTLIRGHKYSSKTGPLWCLCVHTYLHDTEVQHLK